MNETLTKLMNELQVHAERAYNIATEIVTLLDDRAQDLDEDEDDLALGAAENLVDALDVEQEYSELHEAIETIGDDR